MDQGSLHIEADQITIYHDDKEADRILATGSPARLQQQPELEKGPIKASANTIEYFKTEDRIQLRENANIEQEGSIVTGDSIDYLMNEQTGQGGLRQKQRVQPRQSSDPGRSGQRRGALAWLVYRQIIWPKPTVVGKWCGMFPCRSTAVRWSVSWAPMARAKPLVFT